jgi:hypothetical protein
MAIYIHATGNTIIKYPFSRAELTAAYPNVSFAANPTPEDLAPFDVHPVAATPRPVDTRTERAIEGDPMLTADGWQQVYSLRDATPDEIAAYDVLNASPPDWDGFKFSLLSNQEINAGLIASISIAPAATIGIVPSLINAESGKYGDFRAAWLTLRRCGALTKESADLVTALASECNLPDDFIRLLR